MFCHVVPEEAPTDLNTIVMHLNVKCTRKPNVSSSAPRELRLENGTGKHFRYGVALLIPFQFS
jgi:hypothetical protein